MSKVTTIGIHDLALAQDDLWTEPYSVAVLLHPVYTFGGTRMQNVIEVKGLEEMYTPGDDANEYHNEHIDMMTAADARALAALLIKAADAAEAAQSE